MIRKVNYLVIENIIKDWEKESASNDFVVVDYKLVNVEGVNVTYIMLDKKESMFVTSKIHEI